MISVGSERSDAASTASEDLSDLAHVALGVIWKQGPCTAYAVMQQLADSPSSHWRAGAGSIYPLVKRLDRLGLIRSESGRTGQRRHQTYQVTPAGLKVLRAWLSPPVPDEAAATMFDPIRTRVFFLAAIPAAQRMEFLESAEEALTRQIDVIRQEIRKYRDAGDAFTTMGFRGALAVVRARRKWMREMKNASDAAL